MYQVDYQINMNTDIKLFQELNDTIHNHKQ